MSKERQVIRHKIETHHQGMLKLDNWPSDSGDYVEVEYVKATDPITHKVMYYGTLQELVDKYIDLQARYKKQNLIMVRLNNLRKDYKAKVEAYEKE